MSEKADFVQINVAHSLAENVLDQQNDSKNFAFVYRNILQPLVSSAALEPYNAAANILPFLPKIQLEHKNSDDVSEAIIQTVSKAIGSIFPYMLSAKIAGSVLKPISNGLSTRFTESGNALESVLKKSSSFLGTSHASMILGATAYGALKDPEESESRYGNAFGNLVGFSIFEIGNFAGQNLKIAKQLILKAGIGGLGGSSQFVVSHHLTNGEVGSVDKILLAGLGGMVFNTVPTGAYHIWQKFRTNSQLKTQIESSDRSTDRVSELGIVDHVKRIQLSRETILEGGMGNEYKAIRALESDMDEVPTALRSQVLSRLIDDLKPGTSTRELAQFANCIDKLPLNERSTLWFSLANDTRWTDHSFLVNSISYLPLSDRYTAVQIALNRFPTSFFLDTQLPSLPIADRAKIAEQIFKFEVQTSERILQYELEGLNLASLGTKIEPIKYGELQREMSYLTRQKLIQALGNFRQFAEAEIPLGERKGAAEELFKVSFRNLRFGDEQAISHWWKTLPEANRDPYFASASTDVKEHLAQTLMPKDLAKVIFSWANPKLIEDFASKQPELIRRLASNEFRPPSPNEIKLAEYIISAWNEGKSVHKIIPDIVAHNYFEPDNLIPLLLGHMSLQSARNEKILLLQSLSKRILQDDINNANLERRVAGVLARYEQELVNKYYLESLRDYLANPGIPYIDRIIKAGKIAQLERIVPIKELQIEFPDLRMRPESHNFSPKQIDVLRESAERLLFNPQDLALALGNGWLGKLVPKVLGKFETDGGMMGRPQPLGFHEFPVGEHSIKVVERIKEQPGFNELTKKEQIDVLWAALLHDSAKRPYINDPGHEWASANLAFGVLSTLNYPAERIQRIVNLISRHRELSYDKDNISKRLSSDPQYLSSLASFYRHPSSLKQIEILNRADIAGSDKNASKLSGTEISEISTIRQLVEPQAKELNKNSIPLLTSALPSKFELLHMSQDDVYFAHATKFMDGVIWRQLSLIESPNYSMSVSLITNSNKQLYDSQANIVALVKAPVEHIAQAYRTNLSTGVEVGWEGHMNLLKKWSTGEAKEAPEFVAELDKIARKNGLGGAKATYEEGSALKELGEKIAHYDNLSELIATRTLDDPYVRAQLAVIKAMTSNPDGTPLAGHNEAKVINPTLAGLGILRKGKDVIFEARKEELENNLFVGKEIPLWVNFAEPEFLTQAKKLGQVVVPRSLWQAVRDRNLPIVILDP